jgi:hypothetical protein
VVSGTVSLPSQGFFSPFPHGTGSLSVASEYLALPDGPGGFPQDSTCPAVLRIPLGPRRAFAYRAVTCSGRPFQTVRLARKVPPRGPATPPSPCGSDGLGSSDFARHYSRNHGCFLFLRVLRWFTSPGSPPPPMDSVKDHWCSHQWGFPIRTSPDHSLLAAPRGLSQLTTSFFACWHLGIPTHALSSLTIKSTLNTKCSSATNLCICYARQYSVVKDPRAAISSQPRAFP